MLSVCACSSLHVTDLRCHSSWKVPVSYGEHLWGLYLVITCKLLSVSQKFVSFVWCSSSSLCSIDFVKLNFSSFCLLSPERLALATLFLSIISITSSYRPNTLRLTFNSNNQTSNLGFCFFFVILLPRWNKATNKTPGTNERTITKFRRANILKLIT